VRRPPRSAARRSLICARDRACAGTPERAFCASDSHAALVLEMTDFEDRFDEFTYADDVSIHILRSDRCASHGGVELWVPERNWHRNRCLGALAENLNRRGNALGGMTNQVVSASGGYDS
jgi:hypothetical protein